MARTSMSGLERLLLARFPGSDGLSIGFATPRTIADRDRPITLRVDGQVLATLKPDKDYRAVERPDEFWIVDAAIVTRLAAALAAAKLIRIEYIDLLGAPHDANIALDATTAEALLRLDVGPPASPRLTVPVAAPDFALPERSEMVQRMGLPPALVERHQRMTDCERLDGPGLKDIAPVIAQLSRTAVLFALPCIATIRTNVTYRIWLVETGEIGGVTPLYFAVYDPRAGWRGTDVLPNVRFEPREGRLVAQETRRSATSCPHVTSWRWRDFAFVLDDVTLNAGCGLAMNAKAPLKIYPPAN